MMMFDRTSTKADINILGTKKQPRPGGVAQFSRVSWPVTAIVNYLGWTPYWDLDT